MAKYDVEFKRKVVAYYYKYGRIATKRKFNMSLSSLHRWIGKQETVGFMRKKNKTLSSEEKLTVLEYLWENGYTATVRKYDIASGVLNVWERKYREYGIKGLEQDSRGRPSKMLGKPKDINKDKDILDELFRLRLENEYLKKLDALVQEREERERKKK
ncbi:helix-turn-helix domain-containing protein [Mycoplasmatota bacterium]|nr:helix-turn-helix domain-containing protein [Mycoplasmatota bacterium]